VAETEEALGVRALRRFLSALLATCSFHLEALVWTMPLVQVLPL
jgi:hypothetical protein